LPCRCFGYNNHVGIDHEHGFVRRFKVTAAAAHDGAQIGTVLGPANTASWVLADTSYRTAAYIDMLERRGLKPEFQRTKPRGQAHAAPRRPRQRPPRAHSVPRRGYLCRPEVRFAKLIRTVCKARAYAKVALVTLPATSPYFSRWRTDRAPEQRGKGLQ
jgi:IS5 family transposase